MSKNINEILQNTYKNNVSIDSLSKIIKHHYNCDILLSWYIQHGYWVVQNTSETNYTQIEPYQNETSQITKIQTKTSKLILFDEIELSEETRFILLAFLEKITLSDLLNRQKSRQELTLSNISHSIRTPLNGILHMCKSINSHTSTNEDEKLKDSLMYLNQSTVALATNISDIIDMTKLELGKLLLNKEIFNIRDLLNSTMILANNLNKSTHISVDFHIEQAVPEYIYSDPKRIKQILINLLENSLQHTNKGEVFIYVSATIIDLASEDVDRGASLLQTMYVDSDYQYIISFMVKDTGPGMSEETKTQLFKPMELFNKQQGLSLRISYMLAKTLNGDLKLINSDKTGSCFEFSLIACEEEPPVFISSTYKNLKGKKILLIDELQSHIKICKVLEKYETNYILANSYEEVVILHTDKTFDLIIIQAKNINYNIKSVFHKTPILLISDNYSREFEFYMNLDYNESILKTKLADVFNSGQLDNAKTRILVVEDEQINRIVIEKLLRQLGYSSITIANNGEEALKIYQANEFDILLLDIRMPLMSGFELADKIHQINPSARMIGITAQMVLEEQIKPWFNTFVYKPIDSKELQAAMHTEYRSPKKTGHSQPD